MMRLKHFKRMTDAYGADSRRWPDRLRSPAQILLERSPEAREVLARAAELDQAVLGASAAKDARICGPEDSRAALARVRAGVMARIGAAAPADTRGTRRRSPIEALRFELCRRRWLGLAAAAGCAVLGGLALGFMYSPARPQRDFVTLLHPAPVRFLAD